MAGKDEQAQRAYEESLAIFREVGDERDVAVLIHRLGVNALNLDEPEVSRELLDRSLEIFRRVGDERGIAQAIGGLGYLAHAEGDLDQAVKLWEASLGMVRDTGFIWWELGMLAALAEVAVAEGRYDDAATRACEQLALWDQVADRQNAVYAFALLARAESELGNRYRAGVVWGAIEAEESRAPIGVWESERDGYGSPLLADAGREFERGRQEGRRMAFEDAIGFALRRTTLGR